MSDLMLADGNFPEQPLHSVEMEMATLGSIMLGDDAPKIVRAILPSPEMFYRPSHRRIYHVMLELMDDGLPPELEFIIERLGDEINHLGNEDYLVQIAEYVPSPSSAESYAKIVLDIWAKRTLKEELGRINRDTDLTELFQEIESVKNGSVRGIAKPKVAVMGTLDDVETKAVQTPWPLLDQLTTCGGFAIGHNVLVRAKTGIGKTPFLTQAAIEAAKRGQKVVYASFADLAAHELQGRLMKYLTEWTHTPTKSLELSANWQRQKQYLASLNIVVYDATADGKSKQIETVLQWLEYNHADAVLVCFDYLQKIRTTKKGDQLETQKHVSESIKTAMASLGCAAVIGAQVSNNQQEGDMTKGGRDPDDDAALIIDIKRGDTPEQGEFVIAKNRFGDRVSLPYRFDNKTLGFQVLG